MLRATRRLWGAYESESAQLPEAGRDARLLALPGKGKVAHQIKISVTDQEEDANHMAESLGRWLG